MELRQYTTFESTSISRNNLHITYMKQFFNNGNPSEPNYSHEANYVTECKHYVEL